MDLLPKEIVENEKIEVHSNVPDLATECNSAEEFISAINSFSRPTKFNKASYDLYLEKYSFESSLKLFKKALNF